MGEAPQTPIPPESASGPPGPLATHYSMVVKAIVEGRIVPFLGAGVNLCGRPPTTIWQQGQYLPSGAELSTYLGQEFAYPTNEVQDLLRVSQYVEVMTGSGPLYEKLHALFDADYPSTPLHEFFATLPQMLREKGYASGYQLLVTTNYDDVLERAFERAHEPCDVVTYMADGEYRGKFLHRTHAGDVRSIERPNEYRDLPIQVPSLTLQRPIIVKIHGAIDRKDPEGDSYVITEDHYIDYLTRTDVSNLMPKDLVTKLKKSHFLFLGYSLRDWNLRVILHRIWGTQKLSYKSWAVQREPLQLDREFWRKRDVDINDIPLDEYIATLSARILAMAAKGTVAA